MTSKNEFHDLSHKQNNFDLLRFLFACLVVFSHSFALGLGNQESEPLNHFFKQNCTLGDLSVDGFFMISGFLISQSWERSKSVFHFFRKRIARIYPGFLVANAIGVYAIARIAIARDANYSPPSLIEFLTDCVWLKGSTVTSAFAANVSPNTINGSLWSIPYEFWCYIGIAMLGFTKLLGKQGFILVLFLGALGPAYIFPAYELQWVGGGLIGYVLGYPFFWARLLPMFLVGVVVYRFRTTIVYKDWVALLFLLCLCTLSVFPNSWSVALPVLFGYLVFWIAFHPRLQFYNFGRLGDVSYGIYLYSFPIQQLIVMYFGSVQNERLGMHPALLFLVSMPSSLLAGLLSWTFVEKHFIVAKRLPLHLTSSVVVPENHKDFNRLLNSPSLPNSDS